MDILTMGLQRTKEEEQKHSTEGLDMQTNSQIHVTNELPTFTYHFPPWLIVPNEDHNMEGLRNDANDIYDPLFPNINRAFIQRLARRRYWKRFVGNHHFVWT